MKMDYDECRAKISIIDIAEDLGYTRISGRQATNLTYVLGTPKNPEDEIVIFPKKNTYFSRKGSFDDKGELTKFVLKRLHMFSYCTQQGYRGVNEVLSRYMTGERIVTGNVQSRTKDHTQNYIKEFTRQNQRSTDYPHRRFIVKRNDFQNQRCQLRHRRNPASLRH